MIEICYRVGMPEDAYPAFCIFRQAIQVVYYQYRIVDTLDPLDEAAIAHDWHLWQSLFTHLGNIAEHFWVAEQGGRMVGYARSINRDGVRELTELFLHPELHASGVGRELLRHVFPAEGAQRRTILATLDPRAQALYLQSGVSPWHPVYTFARAPQQVRWESDAVFEDLAPGGASLNEIAQVDLHTLGYRRDVDHAWLLADRKGIACRRQGRLVGYGYIGETFNGPFALLDGHDFPAMLAYAESCAAEMGQEEFAVDVPLINREAVNYLLGRKFRMGRFIIYHMSDERWGRFENYLYTAPDFFI
jgi:GNAT superfamily N-acetyltransferase